MGMLKFKVNVPMEQKENGNMKREAMYFLDLELKIVSGGFEFYYWIKNILIYCEPDLGVKEKKKKRVWTHCKPREVEVSVITIFFPVFLEI